jgi:hypothetical protein
MADEKIYVPKEKLSHGYQSDLISLVQIDLRTRIQNYNNLFSSYLDHIGR